MGPQLGRGEAVRSWWGDRGQGSPPWGYCGLQGTGGIFAKAGVGRCDLHCGFCGQQAAGSQTRSVQGKHRPRSVWPPSPDLWGVMGG